MEVHPPDHPLHTWRDFLIHIATIVIGLLIAIGLEQTVEALHNRHLLHRAETNLRVELARNQRLLAADLRELDKGEEQIELNLAMENAALQQQSAPGVPNQYWMWDGPRSAAWETARTSGAIALMSNDRAESWATAYQQQVIVDQQTTLYIRDIYKVYSALSGQRTLRDIAPAELQQMVVDEHQLLADLRLLRDLCRGLDNVYRNVSAMQD